MYKAIQLLYFVFKLLSLVTVSIIEDDKDYREGLVTLINSSDYFCILNAYASGEQALPHIVHNPPAIAIIDIKLPGKNGVDIIEVLQQQNPAILCMVCSFYDDNEFIFNALKNGACGYLLKDTPPKQIIEALKELYNGGAPMSRYIARKVILTFQQTKSYNKLEELTERENQVLALLAKGLNPKELADEMVLSKHTITTHIKNIYTKLHVNNRVDAVNKLNSNR